ncbi:phytanoyl-CoA dioxygenase family protein [Kitasatospora sp. NPDC088351]|uniref:phytanoyl-CoA dioxygenase family protein n=1 Tax=Kitasatospora sp. NPDC088351 TaxID=3155180 RepID=UPI0034326277
MDNHGTTIVLDTAQVTRFFELGYLVLPAFLPSDLVARLETEVDRWVDTGLRDRSIAACLDPESAGAPAVLEIELAAHGELVGHPPLLSTISRLIGPDFVFHHMHSNRQAPGSAGKEWHHDYEQGPHADRSKVMVHALHYLGGLDPTVGALAVLPGSHRELAGKRARAHLGTAELPGEAVIDDLPPGSTVLLHSALFHARRPSPAGQRRERYMVDSSYCQCGVSWPPVKPYWRHLLARGRALGLDGGRWPELFAERHFTEYVRPN